MKPKCIVCNESILKTQNTMCGNCLAAKVIIQRSAASMMALHGITRASGMCVDCGIRPATCRDHRHYASPLKVDFTCNPCNIRRGAALDLIELIKAHRGLIAIQANEPKPDLCEYQIVDSVLPDFVTGFNLPKYIAEFEKLVIQKAITQTGSNKTSAAKLLGISFRALRYKLEKMGLDV
jgi:Bacterial regulatory protein, Fis family